MFKENLPSEKYVIWILDSAPEAKTALESALGASYLLTFFSGFGPFLNAFRQNEQNRRRLPDLVITEAVLADGEFVDLHKSSGLSPIPFMVISSSNTLEVINTCLGFGAEDFLLKPMDANLLQAKLKRRFELKKLMGNNRTVDLHLTPFTLSANNSTGTCVKLTLKEFQILSVIYAAYPQAKSREKILKEVWGDTQVVHKAFDVHLFKLREKLSPINLAVQFNANTGYLLVPSKPPAT